ncbi:MAG: hypothetical protein JW810_09375 [Sedimentisphaerales bacterium]|nr:hypothetical protein [Sedimentisphaerales bacterium]
MASEPYSVEVIRQLRTIAEQADLRRPVRISRYEPADELDYQVTGVIPAVSGRIRLQVEKIVGGGFAGQVYRVRVLAVEPEDLPIEGLTVDKTLALKILVPPTAFALAFRNLVYGIGFQGPFQLQVNPAAARSGALWQKFIRRAARIRFGSEQAVVDVLATLVDENLGSCGELSEWVEGRTWHLEVDDHLDELQRWKKGKTTRPDKLGSPEYRAKREFMRRFVTLLHELGAPEFARQYEWSTCKSQPNCLKRLAADADPAGGLTAVDFRAGLALLCFLPMSPGDVLLIGKGLARGRLVQFDRGNLNQLQRYIDAHSDAFADMREALEELKQTERVYRDSLPDITHHHLGLLIRPRIWSTMYDSTVTGWKTRNLVDDGQERRLRRSKVCFLLFWLLGLTARLSKLTALAGLLGGIGMGLLALLGRSGGLGAGYAVAAAVAFLGGMILSLLADLGRTIWGRGDYRRHYGRLLTSRGYFQRALRAHIAEKLIDWHRAGRVGAQKALDLARRPLRYFGHLPLCPLPARLHRLLTDGHYTRQVLAYLFVRPVLLYFNAELRRQWLCDMVAEGQKNHLLSPQDARTILGQVDEPFIQKYLKSLAVHICTLPVTQIVSVFVALAYYFTHREQANAWAIGMGIIAAFQVIPISPGSICRGLYVVYLVVRERNFKDYHIAVFLGFFKYVGYLAFPIQMAYRFPVLARFMAAHWATGAVHAIPVFGERGALLEHAVFCAFYNWPLTVRRRMQRRAELRRTQAPRSWHLWPLVAAGIALFSLADMLHLQRQDQLPHLLYDLWWLAIPVPLLIGVAGTLGAGGMVLGRRIALAGLAGIGTGIGYAIVHAVIDTWQGWSGLGTFILWRLFAFGLLAAMGALLAELKLPEPRPNRGRDNTAKPEGCLQSASDAP